MQSSRKVWGIYNTFDESKLDSLNEFEIWKKIYDLNKEINCLLKYSTKKGNKDISIKALINEKFNLEYLIYYTKKFGVQFDFEPEYNKHIEQSTSFIRWYNFWKDYAKSLDLVNDKNLENIVEKEVLGNNLSIKEKKEIKLQKVY